MKIAIMQPYLFPYFGYFQLLNCVDYFGIGDDVQYIKSGWINRNRILSQGKDVLFTFPLKKDSHNKNINERYFAEVVADDKKKLLRKLELSYKKAPFYSEAIAVIEYTLNYEELNVSKFLENQLKVLCDYFEIKTSFLKSHLWQIKESPDLTTQERVVLKLNKLKKFDITHFINSIGGSTLYFKDFFEKNNYKLNFLEPQSIVYKQFNNSFVPNLSIIDVMMFNSKQEIKKMLDNYTLV